MQKEAEERKKAEEEEAKKQLKFQKEEAKKKAEEEERKKAKEAERKARNATCRDICSQCGPDARREGTQEIVITAAALLNHQKEECQKFHTGDTILISCNYEKKVDEKREGTLSVCFTRSDWVYCSGFSLKLENGIKYQFKEKEQIELKIDSLPLMEGKYYIDFIMENDGEVYDALYNAIGFSVETPSRHSSGMVEIPHIWEIDGVQMKQIAYEE